METHHLYEIAKLALIFGFVIVIVALGTWRRMRQQKLWHDTMRLALEKGQPLPTKLSPEMWAAHGGCWGWRRRPGSDLRGGLVLMAVGLGLYYAIPGGAHVWGLIPGFIGVALLISGLIGWLRSDKNADPKDPSGQM